MLYALCHDLPFPDVETVLSTYHLAAVVPLVFVIGEVGVVAGSYLDPEVRAATLIGLAWIVAGAVLYAVRFREGPGEVGA